MNKLLRHTLSGLCGLLLAAGFGCNQLKSGKEQPITSSPPPSSSKHITLFLCGDVMTGRGIDQVLPHPSDPLLYESYMKSAFGYVKLAEQVHGPIPTPVSFNYIWGDALAELQRADPDVRLINLETSITTSDTYWPGKGIHYRMHPANTPCLTAAKIDYCALANNHVLDWGYAGLDETVATLQQAQISSSGAGQNLTEASAPAVLEVPGKGRVLVFAYGISSSGIPVNWAATEEQPGVNLLADLSPSTVRYIYKQVTTVKRAGDIVVVSIHWGGNWGYTIPAAHSRFAHQLIDEAGVAVIYGHSSHHVKGLEVYQGQPIIYGAGDFLNDYEGIGGYEDYRADLTLMYFVSVDSVTGKLVHLHMMPMQIKHFRLHHAAKPDALWLRELLNREGMQLGTRVELQPDHMLTLSWD